MGTMWRALFRSATGAAAAALLGGCFSTEPLLQNPTWFRPDPCVWDGRFANIAWLQELPKPLTKITWDCPIAVSPKLADARKLANGDRFDVRPDANYPVASTRE